MSNNSIIVTQADNSIVVTTDKLQLTVTDNPTNLLTIDDVETILVESSLLNIASITQTQTLIAALETVNILAIAEQGPAGANGAAGAGFIHTQTTPATVWTANHNLGFYPAVAVSNSGGEIGLPDVANISINQVRAYFQTATAGQLRCV